MRDGKPTFADRVNAVVRRIPKGSVLTYADVARRAGNPRAFRAVGNILNKNRDPGVPCHRVVRSDGSVGGYAWGARKKAERLRREGMRVDRTHGLRLAGYCAAIGILAAFASPRTARAAAATAPVKPEHTRPPVVQVWGNRFATSTAFAALPASTAGGGAVAAGDLDGDGTDEIVVGAGPGSEPYVNVFNANGVKQRAFLAYAKEFKGGVRVAVGDVNGDGHGEIITAPGPGIESRVFVFAADGSQGLPGGALAYHPSFAGGVHVAVGDLNGDGKAEIVTSPGPGGGPHVRIWDGAMNNLGADFFAFDQSMRDGLSIAVVRTPQGDMLAAAPESWSEPIVRRFAVWPWVHLVHEFYAFDPASRAGVTLAAYDLDADGNDEIAAARNGGTTAEMRLFDIYGTRIGAYLIQDPAYRGGVSMAGVRDRTGARFAAMPAAPVVAGPTNVEKSIVVDISEQRLYAYEHGRIAKTFLVSTGVYRHPTPIGKTVVRKKIPIMDYRWTYGPDNPDNYNLKNVRWNLNVFPHVYIHAAYWHNNFGHRMSHGCINMRLKDAEWIYNWADVGMPVETRE